MKVAGSYVRGPAIHLLRPGLAYMYHCSRPALQRQGSMAQHVQAGDTARFLLTRPQWRGFGKARPCLSSPGWAFYFWLDESIIIGWAF